MANLRRRWRLFFVIASGAVRRPRQKGRSNQGLAFPTALQLIPVGALGSGQYAADQAQSLRDKRGKHPV